MTYSYDTNQVMHCVFEDVASGLKHEIDIGLKADAAALDTDGVKKFFVE